MLMRNFFGSLAIFFSYWLGCFGMGIQTNQPRRGRLQVGKFQTPKLIKSKLLDFDLPPPIGGQANQNQQLNRFFDGHPKMLHCSFHVHGLYLG